VPRPDLKSTQISIQKVPEDFRLVVERVEHLLTSVWSTDLSIHGAISPFLMPVRGVVLDYAQRQIPIKLFLLELASYIGNLY
jgi:hypothetical protein